jgi:hypothetical protein
MRFIYAHRSDLYFIFFLIPKKPSHDYSVDGFFIGDINCERIVTIL